MNRPFKSFTLTAHGGLLNVLITECRACAGFDNTTPPPQRPALEAFNAIWDTGATNSVITQTVVDKCGLKPTGMTLTHGVHGEEMAETFLVNVMLPNDVGFANIPVTLGKLKGADMLIGMDIITQGDFSISNVGGVTIFLFGCPRLRPWTLCKRPTHRSPKRSGTRTRKRGGRVSTKSLGSGSPTEGIRPTAPECPRRSTPGAPSRPSGAPSKLTGSPSRPSGAASHRNIAAECGTGRRLSRPTRGHARQHSFNPKL